MGGGQGGCSASYVHRTTPIQRIMSRNISNAEAEEPCSSSKVSPEARLQTRLCRVTGPQRMCGAVTRANTEVPWARSQRPISTSTQATPHLTTLQIELPGNISFQVLTSVFYLKKKTFKKQLFSSRCFGLQKPESLQRD